MTPATAMKVALAMTVVSCLVFGKAMQWAQKQYGITAYKVSGMSVTYTPGDVTALAENTRAAAGYIFPVLFPMDLVFLAAFGASMILWSLCFAGLAGIPAGWVWLVIVVPVIYMGADLSENVLLARMLSDKATIDERMVVITQSMTQLKLAAGFFGLLQTAVIPLVAGARWVLLVLRG
jgi:hypothetical protein